MGLAVGWRRPGCINPGSQDHVRHFLRSLIEMTNLNLKGKWNETKGKLKQQYGQLTDDDLAFTEGKEEELLGRLEKKLGKDKAEVREIIARL